ncbi:MAG: hypothetical protein VB106_03690 [Clostridiaceae bacterium]|nr:hypothetical protein [Clostridiaceae bacterium]
MLKPLEGARKILDAMCVKPGESVLILAEECTATDASVFINAALEAKTEPIMLVMPNLSYNGQEPPALVAETMKKANVIIGAAKASISTTKARVQATDNGARLFVISGFTTSMLVEGCIEADFIKVRPTVATVAKALDQAKNVRITSEGGTNLTLSIDGRKGRALDAICDEPGCFKSMSIEANAAPIEDTANGILVVDGAAPTGSTRNQPVIVKIEDGTIRSMDGGENAERLWKFLTEVGDPNIFRVAEFGIGLNPAARLTGNNYVEDESAIGTAHIGIGRNTSMGGLIDAKAHFDLIINKPNIFLDNKPFMEAGNLRL